MLNLLFLQYSHTQCNSPKASAKKLSTQWAIYFLHQTVILLIALIIVYLVNNYYGKIYKLIRLLEWFRKNMATQIFLMAFRGYLEPKVSFKWFKNMATQTFLMAI